MTPPPPHSSYALAHAQHFAQRAIESLETHTHFQWVEVCSQLIRPSISRADTTRLCGKY